MLYNRNLNIEDGLKYKIEAIHMQLYEIAIEEEEKLLKSLESKIKIENLIEELPQPYKMLL